MFCFLLQQKAENKISLPLLTSELSTTTIHFSFCVIMEAKLEIPFLKSRVLLLRSALNPNSSSSSSSSSSLPRRFCLESLGDKKILMLKRVKGLAERWVFQVKERSKGQYPTKQFLIHVIKEGETLTSISKRYKVPIEEIAAHNSNIVDINLVLEGQQLKIPCSSAIVETHMERRKSYLNILGGHGNHKMFTMLSPHHLHRAKTAGSFLVLASLIAICATVIIGAFRHYLSKKLKHRVVLESKEHRLGSRSIRWKSALRDIREPDVSHVSPIEDQSEVPFEDISHAYTKLEPAYQKFLSECGISESGYWRGGSSE